MDANQFSIPFYEQGSIHDGMMIHALPYCLQHCNNGKCAKHYELMNNIEPGFYSCPNGMSTLVLELNGKHIFTSFREKDTYSRKNMFKNQTSVFNPILNGNEVRYIVSKEISLYKSLNEYNDFKKDVEFLTHDIKKFNSSIKSNCEEVWDDYSQYSLEQLANMLKNIRVSSFLLSNRLKYFDIKNNPYGILGSRINLVVFQKFDKFRKLLKGYLDKNVWIELNPINYFSYKLNEMFEMGLFSILENDIKYSPSGKPIKIWFSEERETILDVIITSIGPFCEQDELPHLCDSGFRGEYATQLDGSGKGLGLSFAKSVMDMNEVGIAIQSQYQYTDHHIKYGDFIVKLRFDKSKNGEY